jgi:dTDP-4-amino-4,6-dideoxygalactose transaminase
MSESTGIPFLDLVTPHRELKSQLEEVFRRALQTAGFIGGPMVEGFERDFADYCEAQYCVGVNSGTDALRFALMAAGVQKDDIVLTVPMTFIATTEAISQAGARPDFIDIREDSYCMDPDKLRAYIDKFCDQDSQTGLMIHRVHRRPIKAIIPVHLYGQMADMDPILALAAQYKMLVIEDACQAHGAEYYSNKQQRWRKAGSMGHAAAFSFYPGKNLGACGEGGAVTTNNEGIARAIRMIRDHGQSKKYYHDIEGYNGRLDAIQAGILAAKLPCLDGWNRQRGECANRYSELLAPISGAIAFPENHPGRRHVYHIYAVRTQFRDELQKHLNEAKIGTGIYYPIPVHLQKAYAGFGWKTGDFPVSEEASAQVLSLPMYPGLRPDQQKLVAESVAAFASTRSVLQ